MSLFADFPDLGGPYSVGCHDLEWHVGSKKGPQSFPVSSLLIRLFYPARVTKHDRRAYWVSNQEYARGNSAVSLFKATITHFIISVM